MTDTLEETEGEVEYLAAADRPLLGRSVTVSEIATDGRTVEMLCAPFDVTATVADPPDFTPYQEEFARGAFAGAVKAPNRTLLEFEHWAPGLTGILGHAAHFEERNDALYGRFRVMKGQDGDKALELIHEDVLKSASVFFSPIRTARLARDHVRRLQVKLDRVSLCREGAYPHAQVLAVRSQPPAEEFIVDLPASARVIDFDPDLAARLEAQGIALPRNLRSTT